MTDVAQAILFYCGVVLAFVALALLASGVVSLYILAEALLHRVVPAARRGRGTGTARPLSGDGPLVKTNLGSRASEGEETP
jgi:hypothetical protein